MQHDSRTNGNPLRGINGNHPGEHLIELVTVPPAIHIGLTQPELPLSDHTRPQSLVVHLDCVWRITANGNTRFGEEVNADSASASSHKHHFASRIVLLLPIHSGLYSSRTRLPIAGNVLGFKKGQEAVVTTFAPDTRRFHAAEWCCRVTHETTIEPDHSGFE